MTHADRALARRIEAAEAANARGCTSPGGALLEAGGGCAIFAGAGSPLTQAVGMGLAGPPAPGEIERIEAFFRSRGATPAIDLCPLADTAWVEALFGRGYRATEFNNVLVRRVDGAPPAAPRVRLAAAAEAELWSRTVGCGFFDVEELGEPEMEVGRAICAMPGALCYLAGDAEPAAAGALRVREGLATLFADSTIARFRGRGLHRELIAARLAEAAAQGCDLATASTLPGSVSQRNYERMGFEVVYTKVVLALP